jgi:hypothetical protein
MNTILKTFGAASLSALLLAGCSGDYMNTTPTGDTSSETIFSDAASAKMAINGMARLMVNQYVNFGQNFCGEGTIKFLFGEYMGENFSRPSLTNWSTVMNWNNIDNSNSTYDYYPWYYYYTIIGNANEFLANIDNVPGDQKELDFLKAQALVYRAYCYEQLIPFYCRRWDDSNNGSSVTKRQDGIVLRTVENRNTKDVPLSSSGDAYKMIYADLDEALSLFQSSGLKRDNVWEPDANVAYAVYARAALNREDYATVASMAAKAREGHPLMSNAEYTSGFSAANDEWIWGSYGGDDQTLFYYGFHSYMAYDANTSIIRSYPVCISKTLYDKIPSSDIRRGMFLDPDTNSYSSSNGNVTYSAFANEVRAAHPTMLASHKVAAYMSFKFSIHGSIGVGYVNQFRSSEMYLAEAEADYHLGKEEQARTLMNALIHDSGRDPNYDCTATGEALLKEIKFYRAVELWGEGFDWADKKRYNERFSRASFKEGGNFFTAAAVTYTPDYKNGWTYVTPLKETESNSAM